MQHNDLGVRDQYGWMLCLSGTHSLDLPRFPLDTIDLQDMGEGQKLHSHMYILLDIGYKCVDQFHSPWFQDHMEVEMGSQVDRSAHVDMGIPLDPLFHLDNIDQVDTVVQVWSFQQLDNRILENKIHMLLCW